MPWGPIGVATAYVTMDLLLVYPTFRYVLVGSGVGTLDVLRSVWRPAAASLMTGACMLPLYALLDLPHIARISVTGIVAVRLYCVITSLIPGGLADMREHGKRICRVCRYRKLALQ